MNHFKLVKHLQKLILLGFIFSTTPVWAEQYQRCSETETEHLIQDFALKKAQSNENFPSYSSCLIFNSNQKLVVISNPFNIETDSADYDLNLYLIDTNHHQILKNYKETISTTSDAAKLENIQFDINAFSQSKQKKVIGLHYQYGHLGGNSFTIRELKLFEINELNSIRLVLDQFRTDFEGGARSSFKCQEGLYTTSKVLLIPEKTTTNGLNNFKIKETVYRQEVDEVTCKVNKKTTSKEHQMRFDGKKYRFEHLKFLDYGI